MFEIHEIVEQMDTGQFLSSRTTHYKLHENCKNNNSFPSNRYCTMGYQKPEKSHREINLTADVFYERLQTTEYQSGTDIST